MHHLVWKECREIRVLRLYRENLTRSRLRESTRRNYGSLASSWVYTLALGSDILEIFPKAEAECVDLARSSRWIELSQRRAALVTARLLTHRREEICAHISDWTKYKNISATITAVQGIDRFHKWLHDEGLIECNLFSEIRERLEFTVSRFMTSLREVQGL